MHVIEIAPLMGQDSGGRANGISAGGLVLFASDHTGEKEKMSDSRNVRHISDAEFESAVLKSEIPVFIDFWAPWCGPCRIVGPIIDELAEQYAGRVSVVKINVDDNPAVAQQLMVSSIPTMMVFKGGQVVDRALGAMPKGELQKLIDRNL